MDLVKISTLLEEHKIWLNTEGVSGNRALLDGENLQQFDLSNVDLSHAILKNVNFIRANLSGAKLCNAYLVNSNLSYSNFKNADLSYANLSNTNLESVNFTEANLQGIILQNSFLVNGDLTRTNIIGADISQSNLNNANFTSATIIDTNFDNTLLNNIVFTGDQAELKKAFYENSYKNQQDNISFIKKFNKRNFILLKIINVFSYLIVIASILSMLITVILNLSNNLNLLNEKINIDLSYSELIFMVFISITFILLTEGLKIMTLKFSNGKNNK